MMVMALLLMGRMMRSVMMALSRSCLDKSLGSQFGSCLSCFDSFLDEELCEASNKSEAAFECFAEVAEHLWEELSTSCNEEDDNTCNECENTNNNQAHDQNVQPAEFHDLAWNVEE